MGRIIAMSNQKNGVGKTTTSINPATGLGHPGNKVLLVGFDPQGSTAQGIGAKVGEDKLSVYDLIMENYKVEDIRKKLTPPPIDVVPASIALVGANLQVVGLKVGEEELPKNKLELIKDEYDSIIIDYLSSLGLLSTNALTATDSVIIPVQCEYYALEGTIQLLLTIRLVQQLFNRSLMIEGVAFTMYDARTKLSIEVQQEVCQRFEDRVYKNYISRGIKLSEAPSRGTSIFEYDARCEGTRAYAGPSNEVVGMSERAEARQGGGWMPKKESSARLGKGLSVISGEGVDNMLEDIQQRETEVHEDSKFEVEVKDAKPNPYQPRKYFNNDKVQELADSIKLRGVSTPVLVKEAVKGYELTTGGCRLRTSKVAGLETIPTILTEFDDQQMMGTALLENIQHEDLNATEEAQGYEKLIRKLGYTQEELAKRTRESREHMANILRLLKLPRSVQQYIIDKQLSMRHVRALLDLKDASQIGDVAKKAIQLHLSVRTMEILVKNMSKPKSAPKRRQRDINLDKVQDHLQSRFQTRVHVDGKQITIHYDSSEDLNRLLEVLSGIEEE